MDSAAASIIQLINGCFKGICAPMSDSKQSLMDLNVPSKSCTVFSTAPFDCDSPLGEFCGTTGFSRRRCTLACNAFMATSPSVLRITLSCPNELMLSVTFVTIYS